LFDLFSMSQMSKNILPHSCCGITSFAATEDADISLMGVIPWLCNIGAANVTVVGAASLSTADAGVAGVSGTGITMNAISVNQNPWVAL
jgi:hypothetical protein